MTSGDVPIELEALGRVSVFSTITVRSQISGQVQAIAFKDGQFVKQGALLMQIDPRPLQALLDQARATMQRDQANLANAEADLKRYVPLMKKGIISVQQVETQRAQVVQLRATLAADEAELDRDQVQLGYATVLAPISGVLGLHLVDVGNLVNPSDPGGIVVLTQIQPIAVLFSLPQAELYEIKARQLASGDAGLAAEAWTQDGSRQLDAGTLSALSNQIDPASGTVTLKGVFSNASESLWPGAAVTVRLVLDVQHGGLTVPEAALDQGQSGPFVWTIAPDGTAHATPVQLRQQIRGEALVSSGLQAGEQVVTDGQYELTENAHVTVQPPPTQATVAEQPSPRLHSNQPGRLGISR